MMELNFRLPTSNNAETIQEHLEVSLKITNENIINYSEEQMLAYMQFHKFLTLKQILKEMKLMDKRNKFKSANQFLKEICSVQDDFNSDHSNRETYSYVIYNSKEKPLFFKDFCCWVSNTLDIKKMNDQLAMFIGENDFHHSEVLIAIQKSFKDYARCKFKTT